MDVIGKSVMLEPFDHPGMLVVYQETDSNLNLQVAKHDRSVFCLVAGLDSRTLYPWRLKDIKKASFEMRAGMSKYHPMSFVAKGAKKFLLGPLLDYRKETCTVYFNNEAKLVRVCNCTVRLCTNYVAEKKKQDIEETNIGLNIKHGLYRTMACKPA
ncbi:hypothetical protein NC653_000334 [Populus alba x Populus x berolinensis]|uniref:Uncharacterized protein n=1 Tax=Populus alba x Populus x berolinensis TaxID=444605 RepID=A0AAD6WGJ1_9ROSI|nr:hypothetical protein NC653_000334 [Populus alba x Populus x berolinensis]